MCLIRFSPADRAVDGEPTVAAPRPATVNAASSQRPASAQLPPYITTRPRSRSRSRQSPRDSKSRQDRPSPRDSQRQHAHRRSRSPSKTSKSSLPPQANRDAVVPLRPLSSHSHGYGHARPITPLSSQPPSTPNSPRHRKVDVVIEQRRPKSPSSPRPTNGAGLDSPWLRQEGKHSPRSSGTRVGEHREHRGSTWSSEPTSPSASGMPSSLRKDKERELERAKANGSPSHGTASPRRSDHSFPEAKPGEIAIMRRRSGRRSGSGSRAGSKQYYPIGADGGVVTIEPTSGSSLHRRRYPVTAAERTSGGSLHQHHLSARPAPGTAERTSTTSIRFLERRPTGDVITVQPSPAAMAAADALERQAIGGGQPNGGSGLGISAAGPVELDASPSSAAAAATTHCANGSASSTAPNAKGKGKSATVADATSSGDERNPLRLSLSAPVTPLAPPAQLSPSHAPGHSPRPDMTRRRRSSAYVPGAATLDPRASSGGISISGVSTRSAMSSKSRRSTREKIVFVDDEGERVRGCEDGERHR